MNGLKQKIRNSQTFSIFQSFYKRFLSVRRRKFGFIHPTSFVRLPAIIKGIENVHLHEYTSILSNSTILTTRAKFIMMKNSGAAEGLTVVTGNHLSTPGVFHRFIKDEEKPSDLDKDVVVEEDVWIACNVTLLSGVRIGRGAVVGAGSVVRKNVPPYAIVVGNPAKVIGFKFTPEEITTHEKALYSEEDLLPLTLLEKNYQKYFKNRIKEIKDYLKP